MRGLVVVVCFFFGANHFAQAQERPDTAQFQALFDSLERVSNRWTDYDRLRGLADEVLQKSRQLGRWREEAEAMSVIGVSFMRQQRNAEADVYVQQSLKLVTAHRDSSMMGSMMLNLAGLKVDQDSHRVAAGYVREALSLFEAVRDTKHLAMSYSFMSGLLGQIGNLNEASYYSELAYSKYPNGLKDAYGLKLAANHAANLQKMNLFDSAQKFIEKINIEAEKQDDKRILVQLRTLLSHIHFKKGEYEQCIEKASSALEWEASVPKAMYYLEAYTNIGAALLELGQPQKALGPLQKAHEIGVNFRSSARMLNLRHLHRAFAENGRYAEAYATMKEYSALMDTIRKQDNLQVINELQTRYETEKKERDLREMDQQNRIQALSIRQRNIFIIGIILISIALIGGGYLVSRQRLARQQQAAIENRLVSLRMQLNPHFIFNALSAIQNFILSGKDVREATRYLSNFAKVMRAFLEFNQTETISLEKEIEGLELYIGLQKVRFNQAFEHEVILSDEIDPSDTLVPPMMLQPFVENAIEHGLRGMDQGRLTLSYSIDGDSLIMEVTDNGRGRTKAGTDQQNKAFEKQSLATRITTERIALLNSSKKEKVKYRFEITDLNADGTGTVARFSIPYMYQS